MSDLITIDGSQGEGGGQMVRSSMALSVFTGKSVRIENIRAGRSKPGLGRQHLTSVRAAAEICTGEVTGDELGSTTVEFHPAVVQPGRYQFSIGSAGSAMLVLQTVLPPLLTAAEPSTLILEGGTHNQWAPPFDFLQRAYLPLVNRMGPNVSIRLDRYGFYPAGGGRVVVDIQPSLTLAGFDLLEAGRVKRRQVSALVANLSASIAEREVKQAQRKLNWRPDEMLLREVKANGPGNVVFAEIECEHVIEVFTAFGRQGVSAEKVADEVVRDVRKWLKCGAPVGEYLADQILLPLGLSAAQTDNVCVQRGGSFLTGKLTQHSLTHIDILQKFLDICIDVCEGESGVLVAVQPNL